MLRTDALRVLVTRSGKPDEVVPYFGKWHDLIHEPARHIALGALANALHLARKTESDVAFRLQAGDLVYVFSTPAEAALAEHLFVTGGK